MRGVGNRIVIAPQARLSNADNPMEGERVSIGSHVGRGVWSLLAESSGLRPPGFLPCRAPCERSWGCGMRDLRHPSRPIGGSTGGAWTARLVLARLVWFPPAATSNRGCGSPAHGSPTFFTGGIRLSPSPRPIGAGRDDGYVFDRTQQPAAVRDLTDPVAGVLHRLGEGQRARKHTAGLASSYGPPGCSPRRGL